jgi:hypothetical protein
LLLLLLVKPAGNSWDLSSAVMDRALMQYWAAQVINWHNPAIGTFC